MLHLHSRVQSLSQAAPNVFVLSLHCPEIATLAVAGQFVNILTGSGIEPLLRRPFSIHCVDGENIEILFQRIGKGTSLLAEAEKGEVIDLIGPLGRGFHLDDVGFGTAVLVGGGLGVAPLPLANTTLRKSGKRVVTVVGARSADLLVVNHLSDVQVSTDDGSRGFHGTVVDLVAQTIRGFVPENTRIFACGPTPMLRALAHLAASQNVDCEVSLEGQMACGIGICQGCPVETCGQERKYMLMCKDGPVFNTRDIVV